MTTRDTAALVRHRRRELGVASQQELASSAGLAMQTVSLVERTGLITRRTAERLAPVLRLPVETLLGAMPASGGADRTEP
jgi:DNA-binding XRE family transcriptional regulator